MDTQSKLKKCVAEYEMMFPWELEAFKKGMRAKRESQIKSSVLKGTDALERQILEYPDNLYTIMKATLDEQDWVYFTSKKGARWFGKMFPQYAITTM
jgi:hypothetical protein